MLAQRLGNIFTAPLASRPDNPDTKNNGAAAICDREGKKGGAEGGSDCKNEIAGGSDECKIEEMDGGKDGEK
ncbi:hypothetical protein N7532_004789 [Penicillium argentinense]|uniref:Uncharacterized protein n=1 Tax=Penicillium argentinense TaxID=1131581 RepID=A0A9W9FQ13_9EURO|nr:uncharacterized protein N7532_004789 [Penicillium argentinense]KAJ5104260.1 hypothetical protein N7532_004789 [Penicillium argentinense]